MAEQVVNILPAQTVTSKLRQGYASPTVIANSDCLPVFVPSIGLAFLPIDHDIVMF
ncbi:hypothetical protein [Vibrio coralliilyticus]|uniref:hypothetical protein n=1 Tax=Vibrio coralliilyticus TaxID=190893 RepID=UPI00148CB0EE|nr:hypothetical protein [Vibrio coralliilyticus]